MTLHVLVPGEEGVAALADVDSVRPVRYDPAEPLPLPPEGRDAEVMVVPPAYASRLLAAMHEMPALRLVQTLSAGTDRWEGRLPEGVALSNARGAHGGSTAEWAAAALLSIYRDLPRYVSNQAAGRWRPRMTGTLDGKHVLILGAGDLGTSLRARLEPFGARVTMVARRARPGVHAAGELPALLGGHDAVVVMVPSNASTHHMVDAAFLSRMPDGAVLVNAARGPIVDTDALLAELRSGRLRAALDVTDPEPLPADHPLWHAPGVLITPHVGGNTTGATERAWQVAAGQIAQYAAGKQPENLVISLRQAAGSAGNGTGCRYPGLMRSAARAAVLDFCCVLAFVVIGRASHSVGESIPGVAQTFWPFLAGLAAGWLASRAWRKPGALIPSGIGAWLGTVAVGMALRVVSGQGTAFTFILVALAFLGLFILGWRALARLTAGAAGRLPRRFRSSRADEG